MLHIGLTEQNSVGLFYTAQNSENLSSPLDKPVYIV